LPDLLQIGAVEDLYILILVMENTVIKMLWVDGYHLLSSFVIKDFSYKLQGHRITTVNTHMIV